MPIYAYRCEACGFAKDVLQKVSDPQLTVCLSCGAPQFRKQVTAAGFQLKGTGWYATDFRNGAGATAPAAANGGGDAADGKAAGEKPGPDKAGADKAGADKSSATDSAGSASSTATTPASNGPAKPSPAAS